MTLGFLFFAQDGTEQTTEQTNEPYSVSDDFRKKHGDDLIRRDQENARENLADGTWGEDDYWREERDRLEKL